MATTPPMSSVLRTPSAPLIGAGYDTYEPYAPRKNLRSRTQQDRETTPEPPPRHPTKRATQKSVHGKASSSRAATRGISPPSSTETSPKTNFTTRTKPDSQVGTFAPEANKDSPTTSSSLNPPTAASNLLAGTTMAEGMLPTPVKTPRKKDIVNVNQASRVLFQNQPQSLVDVMEAPKRSRKGRRYNGFSLESFEVEDESGAPKIEIFTDSKDKVPEVDTSEDNPFYTQPNQPSTSSTRQSKRRKIGAERPGDSELERDLHRKDGIVYVHRGKGKQFVKFGDFSEPEAEFDDETKELLAADPDIPPIRPMTRSSIKPRLLFPTEEQRRARETQVDSDEEALTDIEDDQHGQQAVANGQGITMNDSGVVNHETAVPPRSSDSPALPAYRPVYLDSSSPYNSSSLPPTSFTSIESPARSLRSGAKKASKIEEHVESTHIVKQVESAGGDKGNDADFKQWKRLKVSMKGSPVYDNGPQPKVPEPGAPTPNVTKNGKGKNKRTAGDSIEEGGIVVKKKSKVD